MRVGKHLGKQIKNRREELGRTLEQVAEGAGISRGYLIRLEGGDVEKVSKPVLSSVWREIGLHYYLFRVLWEGHIDSGKMKIEGLCLRQGSAVYPGRGPDSTLDPWEWQLIMALRELPKTDQDAAARMVQGLVGFTTDGG